MGTFLFSPTFFWGLSLILSFLYELWFYSFNLFPFFVHNCCVSFCSPFQLSCVHLLHLLPHVTSVTFYCLYLISVDVHIFSPRNITVILWLLVVLPSLCSPCRCCIHCLLILFCVCHITHKPFDVLFWYGDGHPWANNLSAESHHVFSLLSFVFTPIICLLFFYLPVCHVVYLFFCLPNHIFTECPSVLHL